MDSQDHDPRQNDSREPPKDIKSYDMGTGRSYECVFCERGFTTAQALGGHMNIHRKDRARPKPNLPSSVSLNTQSKIPTNFPSRQITRKATLPYGHQLTSQVDFHQFLIPNSSSFSPNPRFLTDAAQNGFLSICCKEKWCGAAGLGWHVGAPSSSHVVEEIGKRRSSSQGGFIAHQQEVEELDLELRLGHGLNP